MKQILKVLRVFLHQISRMYIRARDVTQVSGVQYRPQDTPRVVTGSGILQAAAQGQHAMGEMVNLTGRDIRGLMPVALRMAVRHAPDVMIDKSGYI
jgi:hypothetical protein